MKVKGVPIAILVLTSAACNQQQPDNNVNNEVLAPRADVPAPGPPAVPPPPAPANEVAAAPAPLAEPKGPIDPKSAEAAGQVVQQFGALIEQQRRREAGKLWSDPSAAAAFIKQLPPLPHLEIGAPGDMEGAAGSIYVTVPAAFYGDGFRRAAKVILRRVNDVPGSTEAQRRWHIERVEWGD